MTAKQIDLKRRYLQKENRKFKPNVFEIIEPKDWPVSMPNLIRVLRSRDHLVQVFDHGEVTRLSVCRTALDNDGRWQEVESWQELQDVKDGCGFANCDAVEAYPAKRDVVNVANMRHLWIVPKEQARFFWRADGGPTHSE